MPTDSNGPRAGTSEAGSVAVKPHNICTDSISQTQSESTSEARLQAALHYVSHGWALLPIGPNKEPYFDLLPRGFDGKANWSPLAKTPATSDEVRQWFREHPDCNIGVICGAASGGLVVADIDEKPPSGLHIPETPQAITNRGIHLFIHSSDPKSGTLIYNGRKIGDIKGDGGYVVVPPSTHPSGTTYQWAELLSPDDLEWSFSEPPGWMQQTPTQGKQVLNTCLPSGEGMQFPDGYSDATLRSWFVNEQIVSSIIHLLGIDQPELGSKFNCVLPGHSEKHPSAALCRDRDGVWMYHDMHAGGSDRPGPWLDSRPVEFYSLPEVYASQKYGYVKRLSGPEMATWAIRLLVDAGIARPAAVCLPALPSSYRGVIRKIYDGFKLLLGCKWLHTAGAPTAFTWRFAAAWCGVSERHGAQAIKKLLAEGYLQGAGSVGCGTRGMMLFQPGTEAMVRARAARKAQVIIDEAITSVQAVQPANEEQPTGSVFVEVELPDVCVCSDPTPEQVEAAAARLIGSVPAVLVLDDLSPEDQQLIAKGKRPPEVSADDFTRLRKDYLRRQFEAMKLVAA